MIYVEGVTPDGVAYAVYVDAAEDELTDMGLTMPMSYGETVHGTPTVVALLRVSDGQQVALTPTGPDRPLSASDPETVVAWLRANTGDVAVATGADLAAATQGDLARGIDSADGGAVVPPQPDADEIVY